MYFEMNFTYRVNSLADMCTEACEVAMDKYVIILAEYNGIKFFVYPDDSPSAIEYNYHKAEDAACKVLNIQREKQKQNLEDIEAFFRLSSKWFGNPAVKSAWIIEFLEYPVKLYRPEFIQKVKEQFQNDSIFLRCLETGSDFDAEVLGERCIQLLDL